jgi:hypothetical protein
VRTLPVFALLGLAGFPLFARAAGVARSTSTAHGARAGERVHRRRPPGERPRLAVGLVWAGLGGGANAAVLGVAVLGALAIGYYNRSISRLARAFYGVRDAVAGS